MTKNIVNNILIAVAEQLETSTNYICQNKSIIHLDRYLFSINKKIRSYKNLKELLLNNNMITKLHRKQFITLTELIYINLNHNLITVIGLKIFTYNTKLINIDISYNKIKRFNFHLSKLPYLITLDIQYNKLSTLKETAFKYYISGNKSIHNTLLVNDNKLKCKCKMYWLLKLKNTLKANIYHDNLCLSHTNKVVSLTCFLNSNRLSTPCSSINTNYCDNG